MRKLIALFMAVATILSMSVVAFAAESPVKIDTTDENELNQSIPLEVTINYVADPDNGVSTTVYCVDVTWEGLEFTYHEELAPVWNPETCVYEDGEDAYWEGEGTITVTNRSNATLQVKYSNVYTQAADFRLKFDKDELMLAPAADGQPTEDSFTVTPDETTKLPETTGTNNTTMCQIYLYIEHIYDCTVAELQEKYELLSDLVDEIEEAKREGQQFSESFINQYTSAVCDRDNLKEKLVDGAYNDDQVSLSDAYKSCVEMYERLSAAYEAEKA